MTKPILRTKLCDIFEVEYPVVLAGMGDVCKDAAIADAKLTAAVSNAGGLGVIGGGTLSPDKLREEIREVRRLTDKPFGVDLVFTTGPAMPGTFDDIRSQLPKEHVDYVDSLYGEFEVPRQKGPELKVLDPEHSKEQWKVVLEEDIKIVAMGLGTPDWLVKEAHEKEIKVISLIGNVKQAKVVADLGVDMIVAQGHEAGGHTGNIGLMSLLPQVRDVAGTIPVLAAGGITDGDQLAAVLALGAVGVWVGTAFQAAAESPLPEPLKQQIVAATESVPRVTRIATGKTVRAIPNLLTQTWDKTGPKPLPAPFQNFLVQDFLYSAWEHDVEKLGLVGAGQGVGRINEIRTAEQVVNDFVNDAVKTLKEKLQSNVTI